jgi:hypothetical protein
MGGLNPIYGQAGENRQLLVEKSNHVDRAAAEKKPKMKNGTS